MAFPSNIGVNYGHSGGVYGARHASNLAYLWSCGVRKIRIAYPTYNSTTKNVNSKQLVQAALDMGFDVIWGLACLPNQTATMWSTYKSQVLTDILPWAQSVNNPKLTISLGNEDEEKVDGTTLTVASIMADISGAFATSAKSVYTVGKIDYVAAATRRSAWAANGKGSLDRVGFNVYYDVDPEAGFKSSVTAIKNSTFAGAYVGEFSTPNGFSDMSTSSMPENAWRDNMARRLQLLLDFNLEAYVFCYDVGNFGVNYGYWEMLNQDGSNRLAWQEFTRQRKSLV